MRRSLSVAILLVLALAMSSLRSDAALFLRGHGGVKPTTHFLLLDAGGHFLLNSGGAMLCNNCWASSVLSFQVYALWKQLRHRLCLLFLLLHRLWWRGQR